MDFNQTNHNSGNVSNVISGDGDIVVSGHPADGAMMVVTAREISAAERDRLRRLLEDTWRGGYAVLVRDADMHVYRAVNGKWVEIDGEQPEMPQRTAFDWAAAIFMAGLGIFLLAGLVWALFRP